MNVAELRAALNGHPDSTPVLVRAPVIGKLGVSSLHEVEDVEIAVLTGVGIVTLFDVGAAL